MSSIYKYTLPLFVALICLKPLEAQHCPFDGSSIIVIKLTDSLGRSISVLKDRVILFEKTNPLADSCTYAAGQLSILFGSPLEKLVKKYPGSWEYRATQYLAACSFNQPGYYVVVLNQAQHSCMVERNNQFNYINRQFEIRQENTEGNILLTAVPAERIFTLCTSGGSWTRIQPIDIRLTN